MTIAPRLAQSNALDYLAEAVTFLLKDHEARYPRLVAQGKITPDEAEHGLNLMRAIDAQWRWVMDPAHPPAPAYDDDSGEFGFLNFHLAAKMAKMAEKTRAIATSKPGDFRAQEMADLCEGLAWFQQDVAGSARIVMYMASVRKMRAKVAQIAGKAEAA